MADIEAYQTANTLINRAAVLCSLTEQANVYTSPDPNFILFRGLLDAAGQDLACQRPWTTLIRIYEFATDGSASYPLPADFAAMLMQTGWTMQGGPGSWPLHGPATPQEWSYLKATDPVTLSMRATFRIAEREIHIHPISTGVPVRLEYLSRAWVQAGDAPTIRRDNAQTPSDIVLFDPLMMVCRLRRDFLASRGFDATIADGAYRNVYSAVAGQDAGASVYRLDRTPQPDTVFNIPDTGYG